ncbi:MAG: hypothetical protein ILP14_07560 [Oscillospiraceae bacterium]|nr:hypothetical protein [Oscillospiraceae bacterium]
MMENQLHEHLMENEQLLWTGQPKSIETLDKTNKTSIVVGSIVKALITLGIIMVFIFSGQEKGTISPGIIVVILAFGIFALVNPFLTARRLRKKTIYGLTDKRVMRSGATDEAVPYERIKNAVLRSDKDGHTSLLCGPRAVNLKPRKWRGEADASFINNADDPEAARVILYALPMDDKLKELLNRYILIKK